MELIYMLGAVGCSLYLSHHILKCYHDCRARAKPLVSPPDLKAACRAREECRARRDALIARRDAARDSAEYARLRTEVAAVELELDRLEPVPGQLRDLLHRQIAIGMAA